MKRNITLAIIAGFVLICFYTYYALERAPEAVVESAQTSSLSQRSSSDSQSSIAVEMP